MTRIGLPLFAAAIWLATAACSSSASPGGGDAGVKAAIHTGSGPGTSDAGESWDSSWDAGVDATSADDATSWDAGAPESWDATSPSEDVGTGQPATDSGVTVNPGGGGPGGGYH
jgi:hypothetical protein